MTVKLTDASPCCNTGYIGDNKSYCCCADMSESGVCYECKKHAEPSEGYLCDECEEYFEEPVAKVEKCMFCGNTLNDDSLYCSKECYKADNTERV